MQRLLVAFALVCTFSPAAAQENSPLKGQFYISPGLVAHEGPESRQVGHDNINVGPGIILGYSFSERWSVEFLGSRVESDFENRFGSGDDDASLAWVDVLYKANSSNRVQPFLLFGAGQTKYEFDGVRGDSTDRQFNVGAGLFAQLSERIALRADVRGTSSRKSGGLQPFAFVGITGFLGEGSGGEPPAPADTDGDGVTDDVDQCPGTPPGAVVDATGCQLDSDGDGVYDGNDDCPDTEPGARVDEHGCYIELEETVTIDMNIEFDTDKAVILPEHHAELNRAVKFLKEYPNTQAVIEGHTDSDGAAAYNQGLSERRAKAVYNYLVEEANIAAGRLTSAGFGETRPKASNDTAEGKRHNRRASAVVSGTQMVRQKR